MRLSFIEVMALAFTGLAGAATAVQAYVSWETRGEVARAIVFSERIDACAGVLGVLDFIAAKTRSEDLARLRDAFAASDGRRVDPVMSSYFHPNGTISASAVEGQEARLAAWRFAARTYRIVMPAEAAAEVDFFDRVLSEEIWVYAPQPGDAFLARLEEFDRRIAAIDRRCRGLV